MMLFTRIRFLNWIESSKLLEIEHGKFMMSFKCAVIIIHTSNTLQLFKFLVKKKNCCTRRIYRKSYDFICLAVICRMSVSQKYSEDFLGKPGKPFPCNCHRVLSYYLHLACILQHRLGNSVLVVSFLAPFNNNIIITLFKRSPFNQHIFTLGAFFFFQFLRVQQQ